MQTEDISLQLPTVIGSPDPIVSPPATDDLSPSIKVISENESDASPNAILVIGENPSSSKRNSVITIESNGESSERSSEISSEKKEKKEKKEKVDKKEKKEKKERKHKKERKEGDHKHRKRHSENSDKDKEGKEEKPILKERRDSKVSDSNEKRNSEEGEKKRKKGPPQPPKKAKTIGNLHEIKTLEEVHQEVTRSNEKEEKKKRAKKEKKAKRESARKEEANEIETASVHMPIPVPKEKILRRLSSLKRWNSHSDLAEASDPIPTKNSNSSVYKSGTIDTRHKPNNWTNHTSRVFSKPTKDLPVAIDLKRLAMHITVLDPSDHVEVEPPEVSEFVQTTRETYICIVTEEERKNSSESGEDLPLKLGEILLVLGEVEDDQLRVDWEGLIGYVAKDAVKKIHNVPERAERRLLHIICKIARFCESKERAQLIRDNYWKFIPKGRGDGDISRELGKFLMQVIRDDTATGRLLKTCNQAIIAPAVIELTLSVSAKFTFKDGGGWRIQVILGHERVKVTHWKLQKHLPRPPHSPELFKFFEWQLSLSFEKNVEKIIEYSFKLSKLQFVDDVPELKKQEIKIALENYFEFGADSMLPRSTSRGNVLRSPSSGKFLLQHRPIDNFMVNQLNLSQIVTNQRRSGLLKKKSRSKWDERWFEVSAEGLLLEFDKQGGKILETFLLFLCEISDYKPEKYQNTFEVQANNKVILQAQSNDEMQMWINSLLINSLPTSTMLYQNTKPSDKDYYDVMKNAFISGTTWDTLTQHMESHIKERNFEREFLALEWRESEKPKNLTGESLRGANREKNRYANILAYDKTRVILSSTDNQEGTSYINANYINGGSQLFIATQAPLPNTTYDFYKMIWESNASSIVMLTRHVESGVLKAHNYMPTKEDPKAQFGDIIVEFVSQEQPNEHNHYTITKIKLIRGTDIKHVNHLHYTEWPDHGVPESQSILQLMEVSNSLKTPSNPQVVHCSAGIGRSGTWITVAFITEIIHIAIKQNRIPVLNIMRTIDHLRTQRGGLLTHVDQYEYCYRTILAHLQMVAKSMKIKRSLLSRSSRVNE